MSISNTIRIAFDIQDENINFKEDCARAGTKNGHACTFLEGTLTYTPTHRDRCHAENEDYTIIKNGTKTSTIVIPAGGTKKTYLELRKQRFYCKQCQTTFVAKTSLVNEGCFISKDTCLQAGIKTADVRSVKDIALFLQRFFKAFDDRNYDDLEEIVKGKLGDNISSYMKTSIKTLKEHLPHIQNSFDYTYNNGCIEGINNKIKVLNRIAYGYRNFKNYKNRIFLHFAYKPVEPQKKKTQNKTHVSAA